MEFDNHEVVAAEERGQLERQVARQSRQHHALALSRAASLTHTHTHTQPMVLLIRYSAEFRG